MTTTLPAHATPHDPLLSDTPRLRLVGDTAQRDTQGHTSAPLVGYLVLVPEGIDPTELFAKDRPRPEIRPVAAAGPAPVRRTADDVVRIDPARHVAEIDGRELDLTYLEFELLAHLVQHPHHVQTLEKPDLKGIYDLAPLNKVLRAEGKDEVDDARLGAE